MKIFVNEGDAQLICEKIKSSQIEILDLKIECKK